MKEVIIEKRVCGYEYGVGFFNHEYFGYVRLSVDNQKSKVCFSSKSGHFAVPLKNIADYVADKLKEQESND